MREPRDSLLVVTTVVVLVTGVYTSFSLSRDGRWETGFSVLLWAGLMFIYLGAGYTPLFLTWRRWVDLGPGRVYLFPAGLFVTYLLYTKATGTLREEDLPLVLAFLLLPVEMARRERLPWRTRDGVLGWVALTIPLLAPLPGRQPMWMELSQRIGAFLLPALFVWLGRSRPAGIRLLLAVMYVWYTVEFDTLPEMPSPVINLFWLYAVSLVVYLLVISGWLPRVGLGLSLTRGEMAVALREFALYMPFPLVIGTLTGFVRLHWGWPGWSEAFLKALGIFLFTALPEEILFRGIIYGYLEDKLENIGHALAISAVIFGIAHVNNPPMVGVYVLLATLAGWFYGRAYIHTRRVTAAALVHTGVNWVWSTFG